MLANECRNVALTDVVLLVTLASLLAAALPSGAAHDFIRLYYTYSNLHRTRCDSVVGRGRRLGWFVGSGRALARRRADDVVRDALLHGLAAAGGVRSQTASPGDLLHQGVRHLAAQVTEWLS